MVTNDAPHWFPDHREGERRLRPSRRSGLDRRYQGTTAAVERRRAGERRVLADRRTWTERRQDVTAEEHGEGHVSLPHQDLAGDIGKAQVPTQSLARQSML